MELCREKARVLPLDVLQPCAQNGGLQGGEGESEKAPPLVCCFTSSSIALMCRGRTHVPPQVDLPKFHLTRLREEPLDGCTVDPTWASPC